jgi:hypothetical protein
MKKSLKNLVHKFESAGSKKIEGGFLVFSNVRGGTLIDVDPEPPGTVNDVCNGTNPTGCSNRVRCSDTTNNLGCHNYGTCFAD